MGSIFAEVEAMGSGYATHCLGLCRAEPIASANRVPAGGRGHAITPSASRASISAAGMPAAASSASVSVSDGSGRS